MMKNYIAIVSLVSIALLTISGCKKDEDLNAEQKERFLKFYGTLAEGNDMAQTPDGGFVMVGTVMGKSSEDILLVKTDAFGNKQWSKSFNGPKTGASDKGMAVMVDAYGNYAVIGITEEDKDVIIGEDTITQTLTSTYFIVTDYAGTVLHKKSFSSGLQDEHERGFDLISTSEGKYILVGERTLKNGYTVGIIREIDGGNSYKVTEYEPIDILPFNGIPNDQSRNLSIRSVTMVQDGNLVLTGITNQGDGNNDLSDNVFCIKYILGQNNSDPAGNFWFGGSQADSGFSIISDGDNSIVIVGSKSQDNRKNLYSLKIDNLGSLSPATIWEYTPAGSFEKSGKAIVKVNDGYVICGYVEDPGNLLQRQIYLTKIGLDGSTLLWERNYGYTGFDEANTLVETSDGGFAIFGTSSDERGNRVMCLIKTDALGNVK